MWVEAGGTHQSEPDTEGVGCSWPSEESRRLALMPEGSVSVWGVGVGRTEIPNVQSLIVRSSASLN